MSQKLIMNQDMTKDFVRDILKFTFINFELSDYACCFTSIWELKDGGRTLYLVKVSVDEILLGENCNSGLYLQLRKIVF